MDPALQPSTLEVVPDPNQPVEVQPGQEVQPELNLPGNEQQTPDANAQLAAAVASGMEQFAAQQQQRQTPGIGVQPEPQQQQQQRQLTPEEYNEAMRVAQFTSQNAADLHGALTAEEFNPENVTAWMTNFRDAIMGQAQRFVELQTQAMQMQLQEQFSPALSYVQQQQAQKQKDSFFKAYPAAKNFEKILPTAAGTLKGRQFANAEEEQKALAEALETVVRSFGNPQFSLKQQKQNQQVNQQPGPIIAGALPGVGGPGQGGAQTPSTQGAAMAIR